MWQYNGQERPNFAIEPRPDQESVWDYPRPPRLDFDKREVVIADSTGESIAKTQSAIRLCETASPPQFYVPIDDVVLSRLQIIPGSSFCEWKGRARYWGLAGINLAVCWDYPDVNHAYEALRDHFAFYPGRVRCFVGGEAVVPQSGEFYGGWVTPELVGPFKGDPGTGHW